MEEKNGLNRRDFLAGLASVPVFGLFIGSYLSKLGFYSDKKKAISSEINLDSLRQEEFDITQTSKGDLLRLGIIGVGSRGYSVLESLGFSKTSTKDYSHGDLNVRLTGVCDVYDVHADEGTALSKYNRFSKSNETLPAAQIYKNYREMLNSNDIDAVIITSPDHWHAQMVIDAVQAGKHIYCEKCLTRTIEETYTLNDVLSNANIVFQYGHQNRQQKSYEVAREILQKEILGKISVIKTHTNRNNERGAWLRHIGKENTDPKLIDWKQWLGAAKYEPFTPDRFFGWQKFFEYSGGLPAHMFSHEYDAINQVLDLGIPKSVSATGGIYYWKDTRNTPDVFQAAFEYPDKELVLTYDATLASSSTGMYESGAKVKELFGSDAWMRLGMNIDVIVDRHSKKYKQKLTKGIISPNVPFLTYYPGSSSGGVDAVTSASQKLYASQGLVYTYKGGKKVDVTYLHLREWIDAIRNGGTPSGTIKTAFEDSITCLMATKSYVEKRRVEWDPVNQRVV